MVTDVKLKIKEQKIQHNDIVAVELLSGEKIVGKFFEISDFVLYLRNRAPRYDGDNDDVDTDIPISNIISINKYQIKKRIMIN